MPLQIENPDLVNKVEKLARATGWTKLAVVERAVDHLAREVEAGHSVNRLTAILSQFDRVPEQPGSCDPLEWDELGLPK